MAFENQAEIKVCRVCLAVDVKMYYMKDFKLSEMFTNVTGIAVCDQTERTLHRICWECAARLTAASAFRDKALLSDTLLKDLVHINKRDIEQLKQYYSPLQSPLTIQTVFTSVNIECGDAIPEKELHNNETKKKKVYKRKTRRKNNIEDEATVLPEEEPLIGIPVKTEIESDPIADNIQVKDEKSETFPELTNFDDSFTLSKEDSDGEIRNTEECIDNDEKSEDIEMSNAPIKYEIDVVDGAQKQTTLNIDKSIYDESSSEDTEMNIEPIDDSDIFLTEDNVEDNLMVGDIDESSSEEDKQSLAELVSVKKAKKQTNRKIGASNKGPNRLNDRDKQKIIALKEKGLSMPEIAEATGKTISCITTWWQRYSQEDSDIAEDSVVEHETEQNNTEGVGRLVSDCSPAVRRRLREAGFEHILGKNPGDMNTGQKASKFGAKSDSLKKQIIALKQAGLTNSRTAHLLGITRNAVHRWWTRWCTEGNLSERKRVRKKRKTTAQEDQLILDRVAQSQNIHIPTLAKEFGISAKAVRRRLKEAGFKRQFRGPYIPLNEGRTKKVDEDLKQRILTMRQNGVPVTEIAMKFRVPRTTIYQWWRRWCKENNTETSNNTNDTVEEEQTLAEVAKNKKTEQTPKKLSTKKALWKKKPDQELKS